MSQLFFFGRWKGPERVLWVPKGGWIEEADKILPPKVVHALRTPPQEMTVIDGWTLLPALGGVFLAPERLTEKTMNRLAVAQFRKLWGFSS